MKHILILCCTLSVCSYGQESFPQKKRLEVQMNSSFGNSVNVQLDDNVWYKYLPQFPSADSLASFSHTNPESSYYPSSFYVNLSLDLRDRNPEDRWSSKVSLLLGGNANIGIYQSWEKETRITFDTLVSMQTGEKYPVDSIITTSYSRSYNSDRFMIGGGYHVHCDLNKRFWFQVGADVIFNKATGRRISSSYGVFSHTNYPTDSSEVKTLTYERRFYKSAIANDGFIIQFPIELQMRFSVKPTFWNRISLGFKLNPILSTVVLNDRLYSQSNICAGTSLTYHF